MRVQMLIGEGVEDYANAFEFARAYMLLPPMGCPIEEALSVAYRTISSMQQRQPAVSYSLEHVWKAFDAARAELKRIKS